MVITVLKIITLLEHIAVDILAKMQGFNGNVVYLRDSLFILRFLSSEKAALISGFFGLMG